MQPSPSAILRPLNSFGLCDAVIIVPPFIFRRFLAKYIIGLAAQPMLTTSTPAESRPFMNDLAYPSELSLLSKPTTAFFVLCLRRYVPYALPSNSYRPLLSSLSTRPLMSYSRKISFGIDCCTCFRYLTTDFFAPDLLFMKQELAERSFK